MAGATTALEDMNLNILLGKLKDGIAMEDRIAIVTKIVAHYRFSQTLDAVFESQENEEEHMRKIDNLLSSHTPERTLALYHWMLKENAPSNHSRFTSFFKRIVCFSLVREFDGHEDIGYVSSDFAGAATKAFTSLHIIHSLMHLLSFKAEDICSAGGDFTNLVESLIDCTIPLILQHLDEASLWTSHESKELASQILEDILKHKNYSSFSVFLCGDSTNQTDGHFMKLSKELLPKLTKSNWKQNPAACKVFSMCLLEIKFPNTSLFMDQLVPISLLFSDDHQLENKILGVKCLHHIIQNTSRSELSWFNRIDVIYSTLQHLLYTHDAALLDRLLPCLLDTLKVFNQISSKSVSCNMRPVSKIDNVFERLLNDMHLENNLTPRRIYCGYLTQFIELIGIGVVRHFKKLFTLMAAFLEISDGQEETSRLLMLQVLQCVIKIAWPRITPKCKTILCMLVPLVYELAANKGVWAEGVKSKLLSNCEEVIKLLNKVCPDQIESYLKELQNVETLPDCDKIIQDWHQSLNAINS